MNLPQAHCHNKTHALFFFCTIERVAGCVVLRVGAVGKERLHTNKNNTINKSTTDCFYWDAVV